MRHIVVFGEVFKGCGRVILCGLRRLVSTMCFFVVMVSQMGMSSSSEAESRRLCLADSVEAGAEDFACFRRAVEAFRVYIR